MNHVLIVILLGLFAAPLNAAKVKHPTRELLLSGCKIPDKREFKLSSKIGPCDDFHAYVCSEEENAFTLPDDRTNWTFSMTDNTERVLCARKKYFELLGKGYTPLKERAKKIQPYFTACMNAPASAAEETNFVKAQKSAIEAIKTSEELTQFLESRIDQPYFTFVDLSTIPSQDDPRSLDALFFPRGRTLPERSYYADKKVTDSFLKVIEQFFSSVGVKDNKQAARDVLEFEIAYANVIPLPAEIRDRVSQKMNMTKADFLQKYPQLKLTRILSRVPDSTSIRNLAPEALAFLNEAMTDSNLRVLKNVLLFQTLRTSMDDAYPEYFDKAFEFNTTFLGGPKKRPDRQERCTKIASSVFNKEFDEELIDILFPGFDAKRVEDLVHEIRATLAHDVQNVSWLSKPARKEASLKITSAALSVVKPKTEADWDFLPEFHVVSDRPYANERAFQKANFEKDLAELSQPRIRTRWSMAPLTLNAYYSPADNKFVLLQGILQPPLYDQRASDIQNLGAIGVIVGHELGHAIDDKGSRYDASGTLRSWMSEKDLKAFAARSAGFVDQFNKIGHNGAFTLGENIGDHVGLTSAYQTATRLKPNLSQAEKKEFFVSYARIWCEVQTPGFEKQRLKTAPHALGRERINQQVIHNPGFYEAFSCKEGQKMFLSPKDRIRVW